MATESSVIRIRPATSEDAEHMQRIHTSSVRGLCAQHYTSEQIDGWLSGRTPEGYLEGIRRGEMLVADLRDQPVGFAHAVTGEILAIFVAAEFADRGVGGALLKAAIAAATQNHDGPIRLDATLNAVPFYRKFGFVEVCEGVSTKRGMTMPILTMERPN